jgi:hypothetical protein
MPRFPFLKIQSCVLEPDEPPRRSPRLLENANIDTETAKQRTDRVTDDHKISFPLLVAARASGSF